MTPRRIVLMVLVAALVTLIPLTIACSAAGRWLVVADPLQPARAVVVLGGHVPFRAMEAAAVYSEGWAREVWLTQGALHEEDLALEQLRIERTQEHLLSRQVAERLGVPPAAIAILPGRNVNTADEVRTVARHLQEVGGDRVIIVTSKSHARRVQVLWHVLVGSHPQVVVRYAPDDPFDPDRWWRNTKDAMSVSREWFAVLNAWAGFPVKSTR